MLSKELLDILCCPKCKGDLDYKPAENTLTCKQCGKVYEIGSTSQDIQVELCAACHPFYTGKQKIIDTARRVEKFQERVALKKESKTGKKVKAAKRSAQKISKREEKEKAQT